jgi:hypothetical protein
MKEEIKDIRAGFTCSCCGQYVKMYKRRFGSSMAAVLILLVRYNKTEFIHIENWLKEIGKPNLRADFHKSVFWNLLEKMDGERADKSKRTGYYKITGRGMAFARGEFTIPESVLILNNQFKGFEGNDITVYQALKNKFDYSELMNITASVLVERPAKYKTQSDINTNQQPRLF